MKQYASIGLCVGQSGPPDSETVYRHADLQARDTKLAELAEQIRCIEYNWCGANGWTCDNCKLRGELMAALEETK